MTLVSNPYFSQMEMEMAILAYRHYHFLKFFILK